VRWDEGVRGGTRGGGGCGWGWHGVRAARVL
jgi:hypothetical protein